MFGRQRFFEFRHNRLGHGRLQRELRGKGYGGFLQLAVRAAVGVVVEAVDLLLGESGPLTEGFVMVDSVMTFVEQAGLQVGEFP